jgi:hypothetical protein
MQIVVNVSECWAITEPAVAAWHQRTVKEPSVAFMVSLIASLTWLVLRPRDFAFSIAFNTARSGMARSSPGDRLQADVCALSRRPAAIFGAHASFSGSLAAQKRIGCDPAHKIAAVAGTHLCLHLSLSNAYTSKSSNVSISFGGSEYMDRLDTSAESTAAPPRPGFAARPPAVLVTFIVA